MESNTESGRIVDVGSLYARLQAVSDQRKLRGRRYSLALILVLIILAKICGENHILGIAEWAKNRADLFVELLHLKRKGMPHHSTYRRILEHGVNVEELEKMSSDFLSGKAVYGKQVLVAIDGKVLRGTLDDQ